MVNFHISLTEFRNESRVLKEISSLNKSSIFDRFIVIALGSNDLPRIESPGDNFTIYRLKLRSRSLPKSAPFQLIKFFEFFIRSMYLLFEERPSVLNVHTLALLPFGWLSKLLFRCQLVYDAHELETEKNGLTGGRQRVSRYVERIFIKSCDLIIVVGENIADWYVDAYKIKRPVVVKNAPFRIERRKNNLFRERLDIREDQKILLYQGALLTGRGVHLVLDAFKRREDDSIVAVFMGYGELEKDVQEAAQKYSNIRFTPAVPPNRVLDYTSSADVGIHMIQNTCLNHFYCMPNKFFEYTMAGLPVLISNMKEMSETVCSYRFGSIIKDESSEGINEAIDNIMDQDFKVMSDSAYQFASNNAWEYQEKLMISGYQEMLSR